MERITIDQAAHQLGVSARTVRRRIRDGTLPAEQEPTAQGFRYWVLFEPVQTDGQSSPDSGTASGEPSVQLLDQLASERDYLRGLVADQQRTIERLTEQTARYQLLLGQAQELARLPATGGTGQPVTTLVSGPASSQPAVPAGHVPPGRRRRRRPLWERLVAALRGP